MYPLICTPAMGLFGGPGWSDVCSLRGGPSQYHNWFCHFGVLHFGVTAHTDSSRVVTGHALSLSEPLAMYCHIPIRDGVILRFTFIVDMESFFSLQFFSVV